MPAKKPATNNCDQMGKKPCVFFYVFWGIISLIVTGLILAVRIGGTVGLLCRRAAEPPESNKTVSVATPKKVPLTAQEKLGAETILEAG